NYAWEHGLPASSRTGFEYAFSPYYQVESLRWIMLWRTRQHRYEAMVEWTWATGVLTYQDNLGAPIPFGTIHKLKDTTVAFSVGKIVADYGATPPEYVRFIFNDTEHSLAGIPLQRIVDASGQRLEFQVWFFGDEFFNGY
ncbi:unnamed protein product, partial [marine sediment metagenome]